MKNTKNYFEKNGFIVGDSCKCTNANRNEWSHRVKKFTDYDEFLKWLHTEEYDFREREAITKTEAKRLGYCE